MLANQSSRRGDELAALRAVVDELVAQQQALAERIATLQAQISDLAAPAVSADVVAPNRLETGATCAVTPQRAAGIATMPPRACEPDDPIADPNPADVGIFDFDVARLAPDAGQAVIRSERLTLIRGVDASAAALLNSVGIDSFSDIAALTPEDVAELGALLGDARRISSQNWIEQAALLASGIQTDFARRMTTPPKTQDVRARKPIMWAIAGQPRRSTQQRRVSSVRTPAPFKKSARRQAASAVPVFKNAKRHGSGAPFARWTGVAAAVALASLVPFGGGGPVTEISWADHFRSDRSGLATCAFAAPAPAAINCTAEAVWAIFAIRPWG